MTSRAANRRLRLLLLFFGVVFAAVLARGLWLQGVQAASLAKLAANQHRETVTVSPARGAIYDRTGVQLAVAERATTVYADPRSIRNPRLVATAASRALELDENALFGELANRTRGFVYVERKADPQRAEVLAERKLPGLGFYPEERRAYPLHSVAAQVLGYAGIDNRGLAGLENSLDRVLAGRPGRRTVVRDPIGRAIHVVDSGSEREGRDVHLTIDRILQANAEAVLRRTVAEWGAKSASAIVLDPHTGAILAMAVAPTFDANQFGAVPPDLQRNRAVTDTYEPGSTFKLVTVAGALSERLVRPRSAFTLSPSIHIADREIHDAEARGTERMTVAQILSRSSNVGAVTLAQLLGPQRLMSWIGRFGFGRRTGIDFPGESRGIVLPLDRWSGSTIGNVPIGQGIAVTPVQMAAAYAAVANKGVWIRPHLVSRVAGEGPLRPARRRIVSRKVASQLIRMLRDVVDEGTGTKAAVPGYEVAGKTGTAAKPDAGGGYSTSRYVASFVGLVPASRPRLVIMVTVDEPRRTIWGGIVAAPAFQRIASFALEYLDVPPDAPCSDPTCPPQAGR
jgi:cell division protein FtsI/penicillin-binding protein 2